MVQRGYGEVGELARAVAEGDGEAERALVERFRRGVRVILRRAGAPAEALDDLEQETFRLALERLRAGVLRDPERLAGFMAGLARNVGLAGRRAQLREVATGEAEEEAAGDEPQPGPLGELLRQEEAAVVRAVLEEMGTARDREVLRRTYLLGHDKERICRELDLDARQLDRVLSRARTRYRALYQRRLDR